MTKPARTKPLREALAKTAASDETRTVYALLERQAPELATVLPAGVSVEAFTRSVLAEVRRSPQLLECEPEQVIGAMLLASQLGLEPGPLGLVYLVPVAKAVEFVIGYRGYIELAYRSGHLRDFAASLVYEGDAFAYRQGTRPYLDHVPVDHGGSGEIAAAYAVARLKTGGATFAVIYEADWTKARKASPAGTTNAGPWKDEPGAMIRKTAVRRLAPFLPRGTVPMLADVYDGAPAPELADLADTGGAS